MDWGGWRLTFDATADILSAKSSASEEGLATEGTIRREVNGKTRRTGSYTLGSCLSRSGDVGVAWRSLFLSTTSEVNFTKLPPSFPS